MSSSTHSHTSKRCLATALRVSSSITTRNYVLNKRRGSKASGFRKQCYEGNTTITLRDTAGIAAAAIAVASCVSIFHEPLILCLSEIRPIPWFLTEGEIEVLVDPSTLTNLYKFEPGTSDRDYLSRVIVLQSYARILFFWTPPSL